MSQRIHLDATPGLFHQVLHCHQGDVGRQFEIAVVTRDGYEIPSGATFKIQATKPSGLGFTVTGTAANNIISFTSTEDMTSEAGEIPTQLEIKSGNDVIYTSNFLLVCEKNTHPASITDGSPEEIISEITLLVERAESAASTAGADAAAAAQARVDEMMDYLPSEVADLKSDLTSEISARTALANRVTTAESDIDTLETHKVAQPLDSNNQPTDGTSGQSLRTKGDGTTEWASVGLPTDAQTAQAVSDWLDDHPEATTTVQDHSLTYQKLVNGTLGFVTPEMFGAEGDGQTDDSASVSQAIASNLPVMFCSGKTYIVNNVTIANNVVLFGEKTTLKPSMVTGSTSRYNTMFSADGAYTIKMLGLSFEGYDGIADSSQQIPLFSFKNLEKLVIDECSFNKFQQEDATNPSDYIERTGAIITAIDVKNTAIRNSIISNSWGDELIWIVPNELERSEMSLYLIGNQFIDNKVTTVDFIGGYASLIGNYYRFNDENGISGVNLFASHVQIENELWEGLIGNCYDNSEGGRFSSEEFVASNVIIKAKVHNEYNDAKLFEVKANKIAICNCVADDCDIFLRKIYAVTSASHKDADASALGASDLVIDNCMVEYQQYGIMVQRGFYNALSNVSVSNSTFHPVANSIKQSTVYFAEETYRFSNCSLFVQNTDANNYAVFNNNGVYLHKMIVANCTIHSSNNSSKLFNADITATVVGCGVVGASNASVPIADVGYFFASGNDFYKENTEVTVTATASTYATITATQHMYLKSGTLYVRNTTRNVMFAIPIESALFDGTGRYIYMGFNTFYISVLIDEHGSIILYNFNADGTEYANDPNTSLRLVYRI